MVIGGISNGVIEENIQLNQWQRRDDGGMARRAVIKQSMT
jgi:hypothetical protein